jgi:hypothetical protein
MASEARAWAALKRSLDNTPGTVGWKVQDTWRKGLPDVIVCHRGAAAWIELKHVKAWPKRISTPIRTKVSDEQRRHLLDWRNAGGLSWVLMFVGDGRNGSWYLLDPELEEVHRAPESVGEPYPDVPRSVVAGPWADHRPLLGLLRLSGPGPGDLHRR